MVDQARVHLVLPKRELFSRDKQEPSASIVLKLRGSVPLTKQQIAAIQNLVASAVPGLKTNRISIIDQSGNLLARGNGQGDEGFSAASSAEEQRVAYEQRVRSNIEDMLERSLGPGHARIDVNADMDFDKMTVTSESFDPDGQVVRSTQTVSEEKEQRAQWAMRRSRCRPTCPTARPNPRRRPGRHRAETPAKRVEETTNYEISKQRNEPDPRDRRGQAHLGRRAGRRTRDRRRPAREELSRRAPRKSSTP